MKAATTVTICAILASVSAAIGDVPSLINYQGRLSNPNGSAASGTKSFSIAIYDAEADGNEIYSEDVGDITLGVNGIYSFKFGATGTSIGTVTEALGTTDGTAQVFNHVLQNIPAQADSVSITDGTYSWSQSGGSSDPGAFTGSADTATGNVSAIYIAGAPPTGTDITVTYRYPEAGILGALSNIGEHWLALTIDGVMQVSRQRLVAVPFALMSAVSKRSAVVPSLLYLERNVPTPSGSFVVSKGGVSTSTNRVLRVYIPEGVSTLKLRAKYGVQPEDAVTTPHFDIDLEILVNESEISQSKLADDFVSPSPSPSSFTKEFDLPLPASVTGWVDLRIRIKITNNRNGSIFLKNANFSEFYIYSS